MKTSRLAPLAIVALTAVSACGGDDDAAETTTPVTEPATPTTVAAPTTVDTTVAPTPTPPSAPTAPSTAAPTTAAPTTAAPTTVVETTTPDTTADTEPDDGDDGDSTGAPADSIVVSVPGATELTNETAASIVAALQDFTGEGGDVPAQLAKFGLDQVPHVLVDDAALFELTGGIDASFADDPSYSLDLSYLVQSDSPDPEAALAAVQDAIAELGEYDESSGTRTSDGLTIHYLDLSPADYSSGLPRWTLYAADLGADDEEWAGVLELHIETYGDIAEFTVPAGLADLDAQAADEAPYDLTPFRYRVDNSINMFGGFPTSSQTVDYYVEGAEDFETAAADFTEALSGYDEPYMDEDGEYASWTADPYTWNLNLNFEDRIVAKFQQSILG